MMKRYEVAFYVDSNKFDEHQVRQLLNEMIETAVIDIVSEISVKEVDL